MSPNNADEIAERARARGTEPNGAGNPAEQRRLAEQLMDEGMWVDGKLYKWGDFEWGELEELEDYTGMPLMGVSLMSAKTITFIVYLIRRRRNPDVTLDDIRRITNREGLAITREPEPEQEGDQDKPRGKSKGRSPSRARAKQK